MIINFEKRSDLFKNLPKLQILSIGDFLSNIKKNKTQRIYFTESEERNIRVCYYNTSDIDYNFLEYYLISRNDFFELHNVLNVKICWEEGF
jgi:hypothetical protein